MGLDRNTSVECRYDIRVEEPIIKQSEVPSFGECKHVIFKNP